MKTTTPFDAAEYVRGYEQWDVPALLALYDDDVELIRINHDHGPSEPKVTHGIDVLRGMFEFGASHGVTAAVENVVASDDRTAATVTCTLPDGRKIVANTILELENGRIVREYEIEVADRGPSAP
jgi:ketosteroid isomerase-like protein